MSCKQVDAKERENGAHYEAGRKQWGCDFSMSKEGDRQI